MTGASTHPPAPARVAHSFPDYVDCHLRLSCISRAAGATEDALNHARAAAGAGGDAADAHALLAALYMDRGCGAVLGPAGRVRGGLRGRAAPGWRLLGWGSG